MNYFENLTTENLEIKTKVITQIKLDLDVKDFIDNDVILIKSGTATGKTQIVSKCLKNSN